MAACAVFITGCLRPILNAKMSSSCSETWRTWRGCGAAGSSERMACGQSPTHNNRNWAGEHIDIQHLRVLFTLKGSKSFMASLTIVSDFPTKSEEVNLEKQLTNILFYF